MYTSLIEDSDSGGQAKMQISVLKKNKHFINDLDVPEEFINH